MGSESESTMLRDAPDALPVTATAYDALQRERDELAREHGDVERLWRLEEILSRARVIAAVESGDTVAIGCSVTVLDTGSGEAIDYVIDGTHAAAKPRSVSAASPVGTALLGRSVGDVVAVPLPRTGRSRELEILAVSSRPAA
jgi:transcription elongation GreA/GreB family factor